MQFCPRSWCRCGYSRLVSFRPSSMQLTLRLHLQARGAAGCRSIIFEPRTACYWINKNALITETEPWWEHLLASRPGSRIRYFIMASLGGLLGNPSALSPHAPGLKRRRLPCTQGLTENGPFFGSRLLFPSPVRQLGYLEKQFPGVGSPRVPVCRE